MKRAFTNGIILDGTKDMVLQLGKAILVEDGVIMDIVPDNAVPGGYEKNDLGGKYILPGLISPGRESRRRSSPIRSSW